MRYIPVLLVFVFMTHVSSYAMMDINDITDHFFVCVVSDSYSVSSVQKQLSALKFQTESLNISGIVFDVDNSTDSITEFPVGFDIEPLHNRIVQSCEYKKDPNELSDCRVIQRSLDFVAAMSMCNHRWTLMLSEDIYPCPDAMGSILRYIQNDPHISYAQFAPNSQAVLFPPYSDFPWFVLGNPWIGTVDVLLNLKWAKDPSYTHDVSLFSSVAHNQECGHGLRLK